MSVCGSRGFSTKSTIRPSPSIRATPQRRSSSGSSSRSRAIVVAPALRKASTKAFQSISKMWSPATTRRSSGASRRSASSRTNRMSPMAPSRSSSSGCRRRGGGPASGRASAPRATRRTAGRTGRSRRRGSPGDRRGHRGDPGGTRSAAAPRPGGGASGSGPSAAHAGGVAGGEDERFQRTYARYLIPVIKGGRTATGTGKCWRTGSPPQLHVLLQDVELWNSKGVLKTPSSPGRPPSGPGCRPRSAR